MKHVAATLITGILVLTCPTPAAWAIDWTNSSGGLFQTGTNWLGGSPPGASDIANFDLGNATYGVSFNAGVVNDRLIVGDDTVNFDLSSFTYQATSPSDANRSLVVGDVLGDSGHLTFTDGAVTTAGIALGRVAGSSGRLTLGANSSLVAGPISVGHTGSGRLDIDGNLTSGPLVIARDQGSQGEVHVSAGRTVVTNGTLLLGSTTGGSTATATVTGPTTTWNVTSQIIVGRVSGDVASLSITGGAQVTGDLPLVANNLGSQATLTVDGLGSSLTSARRLHVGVAGDGTLVISGGAQVQTGQATSPTQSSGIVGYFLTGGFRGQGDVTIRGAGSRWTQDGGMTVGYGGDGITTIEDGGRLESADGFISRTAGSTGLVTVTGANSRWELTGGLYLSGSQTTPGDVGTLRLEESGRVTTDTYTQYEPGTLEIAIDGLSVGQGLDATGAVTLDGTLALDVDPSFTPGFGATITGFLNYGSRVGAFSSITGRTLSSGLVLAHLYEADELLLTPTVIGDGNLDGQVTGADYTIWADNFGASGASFTEGDFNGDGLVTGADYTLWADHFGQDVTPGVAVPEPGSLALGMLALTAAAVACRRRGPAADRLQSA